MPGQTVTLRLAKENMKFSAGHFTLFGPGERERVHGHDFRVGVRVEARVGGNGLCFDYGLLKRRIVELCRELNEWMLLPGDCFASLKSCGFVQVTCTRESASSLDLPTAGPAIARAAASRSVRAARVFRVAMMRSVFRVSRRIDGCRSRWISRRCVAVVRR